MIIKKRAMLSMVCVASIFSSSHAQEESFAGEVFCDCGVQVGAIGVVFIALGAATMLNALLSPKSDLYYNMTVGPAFHIMGLWFLEASVTSYFIGYMFKKYTNSEKQAYKNLKDACKD